MAKTAAAVSAAEATTAAPSSCSLVFLAAYSEAEMWKASASRAAGQISSDYDKKHPKVSFNYILILL